VRLVGSHSHREEASGLPLVSPVAWRVCCPAQDADRACFREREGRRQAGGWRLNLPATSQCLLRAPVGGTRECSRRQRARIATSVRGLDRCDGGAGAQARGGPAAGQGDSR
jgi:hypothetical protein